MTARIINPRGRGFLFLDAHPTGCTQSVADMAAAVPASAAAKSGRRPTALVIGSSSGYGLATTLAGLTRHGINGIGVSFEKAPTERRTATAGWYRTAATAEIAADGGSDFAFINTDAFADAAKHQVLDLLADHYGGLDHLIYSVAAPRRTDPATGATHASVIKPIGAPHTTKTLTFDEDTPVLGEATIEPATDAETADTVKVMGGQDWVRWIAALAERGLLREGFTTVALTYIGSHLTAPIYRNGSIGAAKTHLEATASDLNTRPGLRAFTSVNGAAVTQASTAIPGIGLYVALLHHVLGDDGMHTPIRQSTALWEQLTGAVPLDLDDAGRIRLDRFEMTDPVQRAVTEAWQQITDDTVTELADTAWFHSQVRRLYGFDVPGTDYAQPVETDIPWPTR